MAEHAADLGVSPERALPALEQAAEAWGAELEREGSGGRLHLPVVAGIRRGLVTGRVEVLPTAAGSRVVFRPETSIYYVQTAAVVILLLSAVGAILTVVWPFFPELMAVAPFGAILALGGWFLVVSRLRSSGPDDFLAAVAAYGAEDDEPVAPEDGI